MGWKSIALVIVFLFTIALLLYLPEPDTYDEGYLPVYKEDTSPPLDDNQGFEDKALPAADTDKTIEIPEKIEAKGPKIHTVTMKRKILVPNVSIIDAGDTITWVVEDDRVHKVASKNWDLRSGQLFDGDTYSYTFKEQGVYWYLDAVFGVWGKIIVR